MSPDYSKRDYLLPDGCKDLIDVIKLAQHSAASPPIIGEVLFPESMTVRDLASLLGQKPFKIIADAMQLGVFANVKQTLDFKIASTIARKYGYTAKRSA